MGLEESIIDIKKLELILKYATPQEAKKLNKRVNNLFKKFGQQSLGFIRLMERINSASYNSKQLPFYTIGSRYLDVIKKDSQVNKAVEIIKKEKFIGFDTEQKPTFKRGEEQNEISIVQIATKDHCFIFQMCYLQNKKQIADIIANSNIKKIGFGLKNDNKELKKQLGINAINLFDLGPFIKSEFGHKNLVGAKVAVSIFLEKQLQKSKNVVLSNWEKQHLAENQIKYASEDATAPYDVYSKIINNFPNIV